MRTFSAQSVIFNYKLLYLWNFKLFILTIAPYDNVTMNIRRRLQPEIGTPNLTTKSIFHVISAILTIVIFDLGN